MHENNTFHLHCNISNVNISSAQKKRFGINLATERSIYIYISQSMHLLSLQLDFLQYRRAQL